MNATTITVIVPHGLLDRVNEAARRFDIGHLSRRIPADPTDIDLVLAEVRMMLEGKGSPFWIKPAPDGRHLPVVEMAEPAPEPVLPLRELVGHVLPPSLLTLMDDEAVPLLGVQPEAELAALELEHMGDPVAETGIYAVPVEGCRCEACVPMGNPFDGTGANVRMILCATCGNKRCPHANDHRNACTNSNDVGQPGSSWAHVAPWPTSESVTMFEPADVPLTPTAMRLLGLAREAANDDLCVEIAGDVGLADSPLVRRAAHSLAALNAAVRTLEPKSAAEVEAARVLATSPLARASA